MRLPRLRAAALALGLSTALAACTTVGPDYAGPQSPTAAAPSATGAFASSRSGPFVDNPVPGEWWRLYADPRLDALVADALKANTDLRVAAANIEQAQARLREAGLSRQVQTEIGGGVTLARPSGTGGSLPGELGYNAGLSASYEVDVVGRLKRLIEVAQADSEAAQAAYDLARMTVVANVVGAYADACAAGFQKNAALRTLGVQERSLETTRRLMRGGRGTALDTTRAEALVEQLRAVLPDFDSARQNALFRLAVLAGRPPAEFPAEISQCDTPPRIATPLPVGDGAALIRRRPDIRAAEREIAARSAVIGVAVAELYPQVRLGGSLGVASPFSSLGSASSFSLSLGPLISWSFPNRRIAHAHIDQAEAAERAALAQFDGVVLEALRETESALTNYGNELRRHAALSAARDDAAKAVGQAQKLYRFGREGYLTVLDAERTLAQAETALAASGALISRQQVAVFKALGGGWEQQSAQPSAPK